MKFSSEWIDVNKIILREATQTQKDICYVFSHMSILTVKSMITKYQSGGPYRLGVE